MQLSDVQARFKDIILKAVQTGGLNDVFEADHIALEERLKIYRGNVMGSLSEVLRKTFPLVENLVGEEFMAGMARQFITTNMPESGCLNEYGATFPDFIVTFESAKTLPYLPDVARFEWALHAAYHAKDDEPLRAEELAAVAPETLGNLKLALRDSVHLIESAYPLTAIRDFCANPDGTLDLDQGGVKLLIYRPYLKVEVRDLNEQSFAMLNALRNMPLGKAVEGVINDFADFDFQQFLQTQLGLETFLSLDANK